MPRSLSIAPVAIAAVLTAIFGTAGCLGGGALRSAKTLDPGIGEFGMGIPIFNQYTGSDGKVTTKNLNTGATSTGSGSGSTTVAVPSIIPELSYHLGVSDDFELGGRLAIASLTAEIDGRYRFVRRGPLHVAVGPSIAYTNLFVLSITQFNLPIALTYEFSSRVAVTVAARAGYWMTKATEGEWEKIFKGNGLALGGAVGLEIRGRTFYLRPYFDYTRVGGRNTTTTTSEEITADWSFSMATIGIGIGWLIGKEHEMLERVEDKLDRIERKMDDKPAPEFQKPPSPERAQPTPQ